MSFEVNIVHGEINGTPVAGYKNEPGIKATSENDTYVAARLMD